MIERIFIMNHFFWGTLEQSPPPNPRAPSTNVLLDESEKIFNLEEVKQRGLIRARYHTWNESRNGIIVAVNKTMIQVLFLTQIRTAAQYFRIPAIEVAEGKWSIKYSNDIENFFEIEMTYGVDESDCTCSDSCDMVCHCDHLCDEVGEEEEIEGDNSDW